MFNSYKNILNYTNPLEQFEIIDLNLYASSILVNYLKFNFFFLCEMPKNFEVLFPEIILFSSILFLLFLKPSKNIITYYNL